MQLRQLGLLVHVHQTLVGGGPARAHAPEADGSGLAGPGWLSWKLLEHLPVPLTSFQGGRLGIFA